MGLISKVITACAAWLGIAVAAPAIWDGTADVTWYEESAQAYNLTTAEQLAGLAKLVNEGTSDFSEKTITLGADIFLNDTNGADAGTWASIQRTSWIPIGTEKNPFKGEFDGLAGANKKRKIYGLYFNDNTSSYVGLFGYTNAVKISNLDLLVGRVTAKNDVGALVGRSVGGTITNVHAEIKVAGENHVGGLVGYTTGSLARVSVTENITGQDSVGGVVGFATGNITGTAKSNSYFIGTLSGRDWVGGIAGRNAGNIQYAYHQGGDIVGQSRVGGIAGETASMKVVFSEGSVQGNGNYVGGVVGYSGGAVDSAYHISGSVTSTSYVGGVAGRAGNMKYVYSEGLVQGNGDYVGGVVGYSGGTVDSAYHTKGSVSSTRYVGGIAGYAEFVNHSYKDGLVSGTGNFTGGVAGYLNHDINFCHHIGDVNGESYVGGLVGSAIIVRKSYAEGNVTGSANYVGGLVGEQRETSYRLIDCHVKGTVSAAKSSYVGGVVGYANGKIDSTVYHIGGDVVGTDYVGGVVGYARGIVDSAYHKGGTISGNSYVGGVVGYVSGKLYNSYSLGSVSATAFRVGGVAGNSVSVVDSCYHVGNVEVVSQSANAIAYDIGGLIGRAETSVTNSYAEGTVTTSGSSGYSAVGGVVGYAYKGTISNCYHIKGDVISSSFGVGGVVGITDGEGINSSYHQDGKIQGLDRVGGVAGYVAGSISNSNSDADVSGMSEKVGGVVGALKKSATDCFSTGTVKGVDYVGGAIGIVDGDVTNVYATKSVEGRNYVGGLIGKSTAKTKTSYFEGTLVKGENYVGGLIGAANDYNDNDISESYAKTNVNGISNVGGLVGFIDSKIIQSSAEGTVSAAGNKIGGLVGYTSGSVDNSYSVCSVLGQDSIGGVAGYAGGALRDVHSVGNIYGRNSVGGVVGYAASTIDLANATGDSVTGIFQIGGLVGVAKGVVDSSYATSNVVGDDNVGGLIGGSYANVSSSYALGNVQGDVDHSSQGNDNLGGLVGYAYSGSITNSMALGNVSGTTKLGGLVGRFEGSSISKAYAGGNITGSFYGDAGNYYIGGLVGLGKGTIEETYASGHVKGIEDNPFMTGCFIGSVSNTMSIAKSYYDATVCKLGLEGVDPETEETLAEVTGSPAKTTAEMQSQETFEDWDFTNTWKIMEGTYPFLQIYSNSLTNAVVKTEPLEGYEYDGTAKTPLVTSVTLFGETLTWETEYTIEYKDNVNAGIATINICGVQPYGGCKVVEFEIAGIAVEPTIVAIENVTYTGRAHTPEVEVYNGETLLAATDYAVEYKDNVNAGKATVTVTMKGNYSGSASRTFTIEKATPVISQNPTAGDVVLGQTLAASELVGGYANADGEFVWKTPTTKPALENEGYAVIFVPTDADNYTKSAEIIVPVKVLDLVYVAVHADAVTLDSVVLVKGAEYTLPEVPEKTGFDFKGLYKGKSEVGKVGNKIVITENTVIDAVYQVKTFMVSFLNGSVELQTGEVAYGEMPKYSGDIPTKASTAQYAYLFKDWSPELTTVTEAASYTAVFDSVVNKYEITFANGAETLQSDSVLYGDLPEYKGTTAPTKSSTEKYDYVFNSWSPAITSVTGATTYTAVFDSTLREYTVTFKNGTTTLLVSDVAFGSKPIYTGVVPTKVSTEKYDYVFNGWSPAITSVTGAATYTAVFDSTFHKYAITFKNGTTTLQTIDVAYGSTPGYTGTVPTKASTDKYAYIFKDWNPKLTTVTGAASYTAVFDSVVNKYVITFANGAETLQSDSVLYGDLPEYKGAKTPAKASTEKYDYVFNSWSPTITSVTGATTYTAVFDSTLRKYAITFNNGSTTLQASEIAYGSKPNYTGNTPTKASTEKYDYTFKGWNPTITSVIGAATYIAVFDSILRKYTVTFKNGTTTLQTNSVSYGTKPSYTGSTPTKASSDKYTYTFKGWSPTLASVTGAATYTAVFDSSLRKYAITFKNGTVVLQMKAVAYGDKPSYTGSTPTKKATNKYIYEFKGWEPSIVAVTGAATYSAVFDSTRNTGIAEVGSIRSGLIVSTIGRTIQISAASKNSAYAVLDMQGRVLLRGRVESSNFNIAVPRAGCYLVRVGNATRKVQVK